MGFNEQIDTALDRSIALGYGSPGIAARRRLASWPADPPRMDDRVVLVTGAASGIGLASCIALARLGATVYAVGRNKRRADDAAGQILQAAPGTRVKAASCDVSSLQDVLCFAERFSASEPRLDVLVNNAGVMPDERTRSAEGHELMFATHVLGPFALTAMLQDTLAAGAPSRVINVSSGGMYSQGLPAGDPESENTAYSPKRLYARTKREQVVITELWAERLRPKGVFVHAVHPGWVDTAGVRNWMPVFRALTRPIIRSSADGADTIVWLASSPDALKRAGAFWHDRRARPTHYLLGASPEGPHERRELWDYCAGLLEQARSDRAARSAA